MYISQEDKVICSEDIQGYRRDKPVEDTLKFVGDKSGDSKNNIGSKLTGRKMKPTKYKRVDDWSTIDFQQMLSSHDESIKRVKKTKKMVPKQNQSLKKPIELLGPGRLDSPSSAEPRDSVELVTNKPRRKRQTSQNKPATTAVHFPADDDSVPLPPRRTQREKKSARSTAPGTPPRQSEKHCSSDARRSPTAAEQRSQRAAPGVDPTGTVRVDASGGPTPKVAFPRHKRDADAIGSRAAEETDENATNGASSEPVRPSKDDQITFDERGMDTWSALFGFEIGEDLPWDHSPLMTIPAQYNYREVVSFVNRSTFVSLERGITLFVVYNSP